MADVDAVIDALAEAMEMDSSQLAPSTELKRLEKWDSLAVVSAMALFDERFGKLIPADKISKAKTVADLVTLLKG